MFLPSQSIRSVIGQEKLHHFVNQSVQNQTKMRRGNSRFPALQPVFLFLLWILIGSLWWFPLFWLAFLWSLVEVTTLDRKTLDWTPWLDYARCVILQGKNLCGENVKYLKYLCCQWWSDFSFQINQALLRRWRKLCKRWWETSAQGLWRWEGSHISVSSWNDDNENSSDGVDNDDFDDDDDDGADGGPLTELF